MIEFVQFKERLEHSNQYLIARLESAILRLKEKADSINEEEVLRLQCMSSSLQFQQQMNDLYIFPSLFSKALNPEHKFLSL